MQLWRVTALIMKELRTLFRDPKARIVLIAPPLLQLFIFTFAATLEVKNASLIIFNQDQGKYGYELVQRYAGSPMFTQLTFTNNENEFVPAIDQQLAIAAIHIPADFSRKLAAGDQAVLQIILDGRRSNAAQIVNGYLSQMTNQYTNEIQTERGNTEPIDIATRHWFNPNLLYQWFTVPSLVGILGTLVALIITALSVARERELGTFDQLLVSPLTSTEILIGKTVPAILVGIGESLLIFVVAVTIFHIPFTGSFILLLLSMIAFILSIVGVGLFISSLSSTQQQAILGTFTFMVPAVTLSGYAAPIENMPAWLQKIVWINPLKHYLITVKGLFLKDMPAIEVWSNTWPLLIIGSFTLTFSVWFFKHRKVGSA